MTTPPASAPVSVPVSSGASVLVAFPYCTPPVLDTLAGIVADGGRVLIDSGAFTAFNTGKVVRLADYHAFLRDLPFTPYGYFALDVIGDEVATHANYLASRDAGFTPWPVFTYGARLDSLAHFADAPRIGVGGLVSETRNGQRGTVKGYLRWLAQHLPFSRVHVLGVSSAGVAQVYRPASMDSSGWASAARFGSVLLYAGAGKIVKVERTVAKRRALKPAALDAIRQYGLTQADIASEAFWKDAEDTVVFHAARSAVRFARDIERRFGTVFFNAAVSAYQLRMLRRAASPSLAPRASCVR